MGKYAGVLTLVSIITGVICAWVGFTWGLALFFGLALVVWMVATPADSPPIGGATDFFTAADERLRVTRADDDRRP